MYTIQAFGLRRSIFALLAEPFLAVHKSKGDKRGSVRRVKYCKTPHGTSLGLRLQCDGGI